MKVILGVFAFVAMLVALMIAFPIRHDLNCQERWADTGYESKWRAGHGCYVKQLDGTWLPEAYMKGRSK